MINEKREERNKVELVCGPTLLFFLPPVHFDQDITFSTSSKGIQKYFKKHKIFLDPPLPPAPKGEYVVLAGQAANMVGGSGRVI